MYSLVFYSPLILLSIILFFSRFLGFYYVSSIVIFITFLLVLLSLFIFYEVCICGFTCNVKFFTWIQIDVLNIDFEFFFDFLSSLMFVMIIFISLLVYIYSVEYMYNDPFYIRFLFYLVIFTFFMIILIFSANFLQLFLGWEGVGLASYLLINFWYTRIEANKSAMKAIFLNKIGDFGLYFAMILIFFIFKSLDFGVIFNLVFLIYNWNNYLFLTSNFWIYSLDLICFLLFIAVMGKSAQLGLHIWLADAMEGPTPVSALIHAATMVTAGVFLIIRCAPLFEFSNISILILFIGSITTFISSLIGLVQYDIKKIIAYSTCSQLGYMIFICGASGYNFALFHMFNHAFFKALLFLIAGVLILIFNGEQDIRKITINSVMFPFINILLFIASSSLMALLFFSGFYSKEIIIENIYFSFTVSSLYVYWLSILAAFCTCCYSLKIIFLVIFKSFFDVKFFISTNNLKFVVENKFLSNFVLLILSFCSIGSGYFFYDLMVGSGSESVFSVIFINSFALNFFEILPWYIKLIPFWMTLLGGCLSMIWFFYISNFFINNNILEFFKKKIYFDLIVYYLMEFFLFIIYDIFFKILDKGVFEFFGPRGFIFFLKFWFNIFENKQTGLILDYLDVIFFYLIMSLMLCIVFIFSNYRILILNFYIFLFLYFFIIL